MKIDFEKMGIGPRILAVANGEAEEGSVVRICCCENQSSAPSAKGET